MIKQTLTASDVLSKTTSDNYATRVVTMRFLMDTANTIKQLQKTNSQLEDNLTNAQILILEQEAELKELRNMQLHIKCIDAIDWGK